jgi:hypothetical protein
MVNKKISVKPLQFFKRCLLSTVIVVGVSSCSGNSSYVDSISDESWAGMTVCAKVFALDMLFQEFGSNRDYTQEINEIVEAANDAVELNSDRFGQLALLANQFKAAVIAGDRRQLLDLVAVEGECEQLGFGVNP